MAHKHKVHLGDLYESNDPRELKRTVEIIEIEAEHARTMNTGTHRVSRVLLKHLDTTAQRGYRLKSCVVAPTT